MRTAWGPTDPMFTAYVHGHVAVWSLPLGGGSTCSAVGGFFMPRKSRGSNRYDRYSWNPASPVRPVRPVRPGKPRQAPASPGKPRKMAGKSLFQPFSLDFSRLKRHIMCRLILRKNGPRETHQKNMKKTLPIQKCMHERLLWTVNDRY